MTDVRVLLHEYALEDAKVTVPVSTRSTAEIIVGQRGALAGKAFVAVQSVLDLLPENRGEERRAPRRGEGPRRDSKGVGVTGSYRTGRNNRESLIYWQPGPEKSDDDELRFVLARDCRLTGSQLVQALNTREALHVLTSAERSAAEQTDNQEKE